MHGQPTVGALVLLTLTAVATGARADDPCAAFSWDVTHDRALFAAPPLALVAGADAATVPVIEVDRGYRATLARQSTVQFAAAPGKQTPLEHVRRPRSGIGCNGRDVSGRARSRLLARRARGRCASQGPRLSGRAGCEAPHKIVEFSFPAGKSLLLQLSGAAFATVTLPVTRSPAEPP